MKYTYKGFFSVYTLSQFSESEHPYLTMKGNAQKAQKTHVFTTVSSEGFKDSRESEKSNSSRNAGFLGVSGVERVA